MNKNLQKQYDKAIEAMTDILNDEKLSDTQRCAQINAILLLLKDIIKDGGVWC